MSGFGEHVDRRLYLQRLQYHELVTLLVDARDETFTELFPDLPGWRSERAAVRLREGTTACVQFALMPRPLPAVSESGPFGSPLSEECASRSVDEAREPAVVEQAASVLRWWRQGLRRRNHDEVTDVSAVAS